MERPPFSYRFSCARARGGGGGGGGCQGGKATTAEYQQGEKERNGVMDNNNGGGSDMLHCPTSTSRSNLRGKTSSGSHEDSSTSGGGESDKGDMESTSQHLDTTHLPVIIRYPARRQVPLLVPFLLVWRMYRQSTHGPTKQTNQSRKSTTFTHWWNAKSPMADLNRFAG